MLILMWNFAYIVLVDFFSGFFSNNVRKVSGISVSEKERPFYFYDIRCFFCSHTLRVSGRWLSLYVTFTDFCVLSAHFLSSCS